MVKPAHASGMVANTAPMWCANEYDPASCIYPTKEDACRVAIGNRTDYYFGAVWYYPGGEMVGYACMGYATIQPENAYYAQRFGWLMTKASCPLNSTPTGSTCTCTDPYVPDTAGTSCVSVNSCPANMSGSPCACNPGTVPNSSGEGCVVEHFTLSDPQNQPKLPDVEPSSSRAVTARVVSVQTGLPKQGAMVRFHLDVDLTSGGHDHGETLGEDPEAQSVAATAFLNLVVIWTPMIAPPDLMVILTSLSRRRRFRVHIP